jgi:murein DD-endopeptidase MepM/ murein hydrolase activator NlpD
VKAIALFSAPVVAVLALIFGVVVVIAPGAPPALASAACLPQLNGAVSGVHLDREQLGVARDVIRVGKELDVTPRGWVAALAAGMQESGLRPLDYGDRDSIGVFQQRDAWGSFAERINPISAARMFFAGGHGGQPGLLDLTGWEKLPVTEAAQAVQVSAYPDAYARWESLAVELVSRLATVDATCAGGTWTFPLGDAAYSLTASFGECGSHWASCHTGQDFAVPTGTPVMTAGDGVVTFAGWAGAYGKAVHVLHAGGVSTWYCHLSQIHQPKNAQVRSGQVIGLSGSTGNTTGPHLHFEVRTHSSASDSGTPIDPMPWLHEQHVL